MAAKLDQKKCTGCGNCVDVCPVTAITLNEQIKKAIINDVQCIDCGNCVDECPHNAISMD